MDKTIWMEIEEMLNERYAYVKRSIEVSKGDPKAVAYWEHQLKQIELEYLKMGAIKKD